MKIKPRVSPHPGQETPKKPWIGQSGISMNLVTKQKTKKSASPAIKECRACFLRFDAVLYLCQGLTIAVSEATGKDRKQINDRSDDTDAVCKEMKYSASDLSDIDSVQSCESEKSKDAENQSNHFALSAGKTDSHGIHIGVGIGIGVYTVVGIVDGNRGNGSAALLLCLVHHISEILFAVHSSLDLYQTILAEGLSAIGTHAICFKLGVIGAFHFLVPPFSLLFSLK